MPRPPAATPRALPLAALITPLALVLLAGACSAGDPAAERPDAAPSVSDSATPFSAPELGDDETTGGAAPELRGRRTATLSVVRRRVVDGSCTANPIKRLCGANATYRLDPLGPRRAGTLVAATTRPDREGLTWPVRLELLREVAPRPRAAGASLLLEVGGVQVEVDADDRIEGRTIVVNGLDKARAWALVTRLDAA